MAIIRRDFLKSLSGIPFLGYFSFAFARNMKQDKPGQQDLISKTGLDYEAPKVNPLPYATKGDVIRVGIIGNGKRGKQLLRALGYAHPEWVENNTKNGQYNYNVRSFLEQDDLNVQLTGVTDTFDIYNQEGVDISNNTVRPGGEKGNAQPAKIYPTYREMIASDDIDAVIIASPDHWHARQAIDAARAGKHVYLEKPMTRTIEEAMELRETIRSTGVAFQLGHQNRQQMSYKKAGELADKNMLGDISMVETYTNRNSDHGAWMRGIHPKANKSNIDWEEFLGNAEPRPFDLDRYFNWQKWFEYGSSVAGNQFTHAYDCVNQVLHLGIPQRVTALGGTYFYDDPRDIPDVFNAVFEYPDRKLALTYDCTLKNSLTRDITFMGTEAAMKVNIGLSLYADRRSEKYKDFASDPGTPFYAFNPKTSEIDAVTSATAKYYHERGWGYTYIDGKRVDCTHLHMKEWINAIRNGDTPSCNIDRGFEESVTYIMSNLSYLNKKQISWEKDAEKVII